MSTILSFLNGPSPADLRTNGSGGKPQQQATQRAGDGLELMAMKIAQIQSPVGQEVMRGLIKSEWGITVPTLEEIAVNKARMADEMQRYHEKDRERLIARTVGFLVDNAQEDAGEAFAKLSAQFGMAPPGRLPSGQSLGDFMRDNGLPGELDQDLLERPEELQKASRAIAQVLGVPELSLSTEDLLLSRLTVDAASQSPEARAAQETQEEARTLEAAGKIAQSDEAFRSGDSDRRKAYERVFDAAEEQHKRETGQGLDLDPAGFDDLEDDGAPAWLGMGVMRNLQQGAALGESASTFARRFFSEDRGQRLGDILRDRLELTQDEDGAVVASPTDALAADYLTVISDLSQRAGWAISSSLAQMGLGELGIDRIAPAGLRASVESGGG